MLSKGNLALAYNRQSSVTLTYAVNHNQLMIKDVWIFLFFIHCVVKLLIGLQCFLNTLQIHFISETARMQGVYTGGFRTDNLLHLSNNLILFISL